MKWLDTRTKAHGTRWRAAGCLALALLTSAGQAQAQAGSAEQPLLRALNAARLQGCAGRPGQATPLRENTRLSDAAARIAGGSKLDDALLAADYRSVQATQITLRGYAGPAALAQGAVGSACAAVTSGELAEVGFHQRDNQTWIVLAAPFSPPGAAQADDVQARVLALVNEARARPRRCGSEAFAAVAPVRLNTPLQIVAPPPTPPTWRSTAISATPTATAAPWTSEPTVSATGGAPSARTSPPGR